MTTSFHFYEKAFGKVSDALSTYVSDVAANIIGAITPVATTLLSIYVMLWGWAMMRGMISEPVMDGANRIVRLSLITGIALSIGRYNEFLGDFLWQSPEALAGFIASGYSDARTNVQFLDSLMSQMFDLGYAYWQKANASSGVLPIPDLGLLAIALLVWFAGLAATAYAAFLLMLSKMALAIVLGVGPIFVLLTLFEPTKRFFDSWMGQALNYVFLVMLTGAAIKLILTILQAYLGDAIGGGVIADPAADQALPAIGFCLIGALVMMQLPSIASALGGGTAIGTLGAVGWAYGKAKDGAGAMRPTHMRREINRARSDVRIAGSAVRATAGVPGAVYRKITGGTKNRISSM